MNPQPISRSFANSPAHTPSPAHQGALSPALDGQTPQQPQPIQQQQFHVQHPQFPYDRQNSSYLDTLSESPSFSFLSPATDEPYNPTPKSSGFEEQQQSFRGAPGPGYGPVRSRTSTQNGSLFDDLHPYVQHHRDRFEREGGMPFGNVIRNNSVIASSGGANGAPPAVNGSQYGMGAFSPESQHQEALVHKLMQEQQAQQARQHQQQQQQALQAMHQQQQQQQRQMQAQEVQRQQQQQQIPLAQPQPQLNPMNAQALLNSLPNNKDYNFAIQQHLQNAQLASQMNSQIPNLANLLSNVAGLGNVPPPGNGSSNQEEISTIFVVGFPDDMQEREFQNMFTFCPGFEAATLKVPSKELSLFGAGGTNTQSAQVQQAQAQVAAATALRNAGLLPSHPSSDPYNLLTTNSGGVVLDSRDLWNQSAIDGLTDLAGVLNNVAPAQAPRKQIIGFAKFRTRQEALDAREVLQGRRVDMEKGSMLKAEMAKKNLHTKRGVGPLTSGPATGGGAVANGNANTGAVGGGGGQPPNGASLESLIQQLTQVPGFNGLAGLAALQQQVQQQQAHQQNMGMESLTPRDRDTAALAAMGLNGAKERDQQIQRQMHEEREFENFNPSRGRPGEVGVGVAAFQAWNSVPPSNPSLPQKPTTYLPPTGSATFTPGITPALPASGPAQMGGSSTQQSNGLLDHLSLGGRHGSSYTGANGLINGSTGGGSSNSSGGFSSMGNAQDGHGWSPFGTAVDPLDTSGGLGPGPSSVVGGPTSSNVPGSHALSRKPSTSMQEHSPSEQVASYTLSANGTSASSPLSPTAGPFDMGPVVPQGLPSAGVSPTMHQAPPMTYGPNGGVSGILPGRREKAPTSSKDSAGSSSPPEQNQQTAPNSASPVDTVFDTSDFANAMAGMNIRDDLNGGAAFSGSGARANAADQNPPINTLYVGNLPTINQAQPNHLEDSLRSLFSRCVGYRKLCFRQKTNGPMCFVEFDDVPHASKALNELYGNTVNGLVKGGIRLSFSKNPLGVRTPSLSTGPGSLAVGGGIFNAPLSGLADSRFPGSSQPLPTRHASMSVAGFVNDIGLPRNTRQDSVDPLSPSMYGSFSFSNSRPFSPPTSNITHRPQPVGRPMPQNAFQPPPTQPSMHSQHQSIFDNPNIHHPSGMGDPRDPHVGLFAANTANANPSGVSPSESGVAA